MACYTYGHDAGECRILPKIAACINYIKDHAPLFNPRCNGTRITNTL